MARIFSDYFGSTAAASALAIFCRAPVLGGVKTRLAATWGEARALELYRAMLRDTFDLARALAPAIESFACYTPAQAFAPGGELGALWAGQTLAQGEGDLGARMLGCLGDLRARGFERVAVIGSDAPDLPSELLREAFARLARCDVVVGPSVDGGFYFLGARCALPDAVFAGIAWSRADVFARLQHNLQSGGLTLQRLPVWRDVDEAADVEALRDRLRRGVTLAPATREILERQRS